MKGSGAYSGIVMSFGKHRDNKIGSIPNSYLSYLLREDWFEEKDEFEAVQDEMNWRKEQGVYIDE